MSKNHQNTHRDTFRWSISHAYLITGIFVVRSTMSGVGTSTVISICRMKYLHLHVLEWKKMFAESVDMAWTLIRSSHSLLYWARCSGTRISFSFIAIFIIIIADMASYADLQYNAQYMSINNGNSQSRDVLESKGEFSQKNPGNFFNFHIILLIESLR